MMRLIRTDIPGLSILFTEQDGKGKLEWVQYGEVRITTHMHPESVKILLDMTDSERT